MTAPIDSEASAVREVVIEPELSAGGLKATTIRSTAWTTGSRFSQQLAQLGISIVLARLLVPRDFGLVGMIAVFTGFAVLFVDSGFGSALVQRKRLTEAHLATAFWLNLGAGAAVAILVAALSPLIALFYGQSELETIVPVVGLNFVLVSLTIVQTAILERRMLFRRIALIENASLAVGGAAAVACALVGLGVWSLVVFSLALSGAQSSLLWLLSDWRPTRTFNRDAGRELWRFAGNLLGSQTINYWNRNLDNLLIGRFVGAYALGLYTRAYTLMLFPITQVSGAVARALFPALASMQEDTARVRRAYLRSVGVVAFLTFPIALGLVVAAKPLVLTLLGAKWSGTVPLVQILALAAVTQSIGTTVGVIYESQGRTDWLLRWQIFAGATAILFFGVGIHWGVKGVAVAVLVRTYCLTYFNFMIPGRLIGMRFVDVGRTVAAVLIIAVLAVALAWLAGWAVSESSAPLQLLAEIATGAGVYVAFAHVLRLTPYRELREHLATALPRRRSASTLAPDI